jgi:Flp pilus assembly protein TadD
MDIGATRHRSIVTLSTCQNPMKAPFALLALLLSALSMPIVATASPSLPVNTTKPAEAHNYQGTTKYQQGDPRGAIQEFDRAISIDPKYAEAYINRALVKMGLGDKRGAISDYSRAIDLDPQDALNYYNRGVAKFDAGDKQGALSDFDRAIALNPQDAETYCNRGAVKLSLGNKKGGIADLSTGAKLFRQQGQMSDYQKTIDLIRQAKK